MAASEAQASATAPVVGGAAAAAPADLGREADRRTSIGVSELGKKMKLKAPNYLYRVLPDLEKEGRIKKKGGGNHPAQGRSLSFPLAALEAGDRVLRWRAGDHVLAISALGLVAARRAAAIAVVVLPACPD